MIVKRCIVWVKRQWETRTSFSLLPSLLTVLDLCRKILGTHLSRVLITTNPKNLILGFIQPPSIMPSSPGIHFHTANTLIAPYSAPAACSSVTLCISSNLTWFSHAQTARKDCAPSCAWECVCLHYSLGVYLLASATLHSPLSFARAKCHALISMYPLCVWNQSSSRGKRHYPLVPGVWATTLLRGRGATARRTRHQQERSTAQEIKGYPKWDENDEKTPTLSHSSLVYYRLFPFDVILLISLFFSYFFQSELVFVFL